MRDRLLELFDGVQAPAERWGGAAEIGHLRDSLDLFGRSFDANPYISPIGRMMTRLVMEGQLRMRADVIAFYEANRAFIEANGRVRAPLIVTGFPRTGTTLLQRLLSEDPATRSPHTFELEKVTPPLASGSDPLTDPRIDAHAAGLAMLAKFLPGFIEKISESHPIGSTEKEESMLYMQTHNGVTVMSGLAAGRAYLLKVIGADIADALYRYEKNFFTMLDAYCPARSHWTFKAPAYATYFSKLFNHYPDARVIVTHRNPARNMASVCRLIESWVLPFDREGSFDKVKFGALVQEVTRCYLSAPLDYREANPQRERQIVDCMYQDLVKDPIAMVQRIYARFDLDYTPEFEERMLRYLEANAQGRHGRHRYTNEEYGIDPGALYARNRRYFDTYGFTATPGSDD